LPVADVFFASALALLIGVNLTERRVRLKQGWFECNRLFEVTFGVGFAIDVEE
jgi:hypothetical protein